MQAIPFDASTFHLYHVIHIKGQTKGITHELLKEALVWINDQHQLATLYRKPLAIAWDGDDVKENSFTQILTMIPSEIDVVFIYALSRFSPYGFKDGSLKVPEGLDLLPTGSQVFSVLCQTGNDEFCRIVMSVGSAIKKSPLLKSLFNEGYADMTRRGDFETWETNYGYWALGIAFLGLTGSTNVGFLGGGPVSVAEYVAIKSSDELGPRVQLFGWGDKQFSNMKLALYGPGENMPWKQLVGCDRPNHSKRHTSHIRAK